MQTKKKTSFVRISFFIALLTLTISSLSAAVASVISETEIILLRTKSFSAKDSSGTYTYDAFILDEGEKTIAIAWGQNPEDTPDEDTLVVPDSLTHPKTGAKYDVTAIETAGFRYCDFASVTVPEAVTDIGEEAFAYCDNLTAFAIPNGVTEIKASTFMDCRALTNLSYLDEDGNDTMYNSNILSIGDHAFDSCVSMVVFNCPSSVVSFGKSCFQKCSSLISFTFPQANAGGTNLISVGSFAFADCSSLGYIYFETNMNSIGDYAFADCSNSLFIEYTGASIPSFSAANWRRRYIATNRNNTSEANGLTGNLIKVNTSTPVTRRDLRFPGLKYSVVNVPDGSAVLLDWGGDDTPVELIKGPRRFAQITGFTAPTAAELSTLTDNGSYYYTVSGNVKTLIIPDVVKDPDNNATNATLDVLTINGVGFQNKTNAELTAIKFNKSLVQISHEVFQNCTGLTTVDFSECQNLVEIGCRAFENCNKITSLSIPYCVEYIGDFAFSRCDIVRSISFSELNTLFKKQTVVEDEVSVNKWLPVPGVVTKGLVPPTSNASNGTHYIDTYHNKAYIRQNDAWVDLEVDFGTSDPDGGEVGDYYLCIPRLQVIGEGAFHRNGWQMATNENATVNLVLPESLNDQAAKAAKLDHVGDSYYPGTGWPAGYVANPTGDRVNFRDVAVGRHAFDRAKCLATVEMAEAIGEHKENKESLDYTCSIGTSCFARCNNLLRFQASENFYTIGASCFNAKTENVDSRNWNTFRLKEIFLTSDKACNEGCDFNYPFGVGNSDLSDSNGDPIAVGGVQKDLVIYVSGDIPGDLEDYSHYKDIVKSDQTPNDKPRWNVEKIDVVSFPNTFGEKSYRSQIPTYWNVDWQANDGLLYWKTSGALASKPKSKADYTENRLVFVKTSGSSDYICSKFYCKTSSIGLSTCIDLTNIPNDDMNIPDTYPAEEIEENDISSNLISIGSCSFAAFSDVNRGVYFVLPNTVERIEERAFYNNLGKASGGVKIVTYRTSNKIAKNDNTLYATDSDFEDDLGTIAYCTLSNNVKYIGRDAFYGNAFESVYIGTGLIANGYNTTPFSSIDTEQSNITSITIGSNGCGLSVDTTGGLYYSGNSRQILVYQPNGATSGSSLTIANGTTAIGRLALAGTNYSSVEIPDTVTTLYGGCFQNSAVQTIVGGSGIKYINAQATGTDVEEWNDSLPFDQLDGPNAAKSNDTTVKTNSLYYNSFKGSSLETINFKGMGALKVIGNNAFQNCTGLSNMTNGATYSYGYANNGSNQMNRSIILADKVDNLNAGVLDLTSCTSLTNINANAFNGCSSLRFVHSPKTVTNHDSATKLIVASNAFSNYATLSILIGEAYSSAKNKVGGFNNSDRLYYRVNDAVMVKNADLTSGDNIYGRDGGYYIYANGASSKAYQKVSGAWVQIDIPTTRIKTSDPTGGSNGDYWIKYSNTNYTLFKKVSGTWTRVGDVNDKNQDEEDNGNGTYSSAKRNYWVYDQGTNRYILFNKSGGLYPAKLVKDYFYYGLAS